MATTEKHILNRLYFIAICICIFAGAVVTQLLNIQFVEGEKYKDLADERSFKNFTITANRGNLYDTNGNLLATSVPKYDIRFDAVTVTNENFEGNIEALSKSCLPCLAKAQPIVSGLANSKDKQTPLFFDRKEFRLF